MTQSPHTAAGKLIISNHIPVSPLLLKPTQDQICLPRPTLPLLAYPHTCSGLKDVTTTYSRMSNFLPPISSGLSM